VEARELDQLLAVRFHDEVPSSAGRLFVDRDETSADSE
jgi:hypothetical protein